MELGVKSQTKFDDKVEQINLERRLKEVLEIPDVVLLIINFKLKQEKHIIAAKDFKEQNPFDYIKGYMIFIFDNIEKPLTIPSDDYIKQAFYQLQNYDRLKNQDQPHLFSTNNFEDKLPPVKEDIHYDILEKEIADHFGLDHLSSCMIVSHMLKKNHSFTCVKRDYVLNSIDPKRMLNQQNNLMNQIDVDLANFRHKLLNMDGGPELVADMS